MKIEEIMATELNWPVRAEWMQGNECLICNLLISLMIPMFLFEYDRKTQPIPRNCHLSKTNIYIYRQKMKMSHWENLKWKVHHDLKLIYRRDGDDADHRDWNYRIHGNHDTCAHTFGLKQSWSSFVITTSCGESNFTQNLCHLIYTYNQTHFLAPIFRQYTLTLYIDNMHIY